MEIERNPGRIKNVKRNIFYGIIQICISQVLPFVVRTILIYRFGVDYLGLNSLFASVLSVLSLMELGFGTAIVYSMYKPVADEDVPQICAYLSYYRRVYRLIGIAVLIIGLLLIPFINLFVKDTELPGELSLYYCYLIFLLNSVISYLVFGYMTAVPVAYQRRDILSRLDMALVVLKCALQILVLLSSTNFYLYLLVLPLISILHNIALAYIVKKRYPAIKCMGDIETDQKKDLRKRVFGLLINKLTNVSRNGIDSLCISSFIGLAATGIYNNYLYIITGVLSFSSMICNSMIASVGNSIVLESEEKNYSDMKLFDFMYMTVIGWIVVMLLCAFQPFISVWIGSDKTLNASVVIILCAYLYFLKSGDIRWVYHEAVGLWWECRWIMIGEAITNIVLNVVLCKMWGIAGIVLATAISVFMTNCILCPKVLFREYFKIRKLQEYWLDHFSYLITTIVTAVISWIICNYLFPVSLIEERIIPNIVSCLAGRLIIPSIVSAFVFWLVWHHSERYRKTKIWIKRIVIAC